MEEPLKAWIGEKNHVTWGTCAGMILLSKQMEHQKIGGQPSVRINLLSFFFSFFFFCLCKCNMVNLFIQRVLG